MKANDEVGLRTPNLKMNAEIIWRETAPGAVEDRAFPMGNLHQLQTKSTFICGINGARVGGGGGGKGG